MNDPRYQDLIAKSAHGIDGTDESAPITQTTGIEVSSDGFSVDFKSKGYRLAFVGEFLYLTDRHSHSGCTCHGKGVQSIDELIALLQEARRQMGGE